jgi:precorrin-6A/cobalt-precorrin-6A reductase
VVDATHPFAAVISANAEAACRAFGTPRLMLIRPPWQPEPGDRWREVADTAEAAATIAAIARRAFLTTGPGELDAFAGIAHVWFLVRLFMQPAAPLALINHETVVARPPFTVAGERALLQAHGIDTLVTKQSGGPTEAKLGAAREVGCQVVVIRRPPPPPGRSVETVAEALEWVSHLAGGR